MSGGRILVIKLGALGDFVQAMGPFAAIRDHHADGRITLLTSSPYAAFAENSPYFDEVRVDARPGALDLGGWLAMRRWLKGQRFDRVYDLQTSDRSAFYYRLFWPGPWPEWSGIARGCSHPHANPARDTMHTIDRQAEQLSMAGIDSVPFPSLSWARADVAGFQLPARYALLVPGGAAHRPDKRWPPERFAEVACRLADGGITPVLLGTAVEAGAMATIKSICPEAVDLSGRTGFVDIATLARGAVCALGNDTGPMHIIAVSGCPTVALFSDASDPALCGPRGDAVTIIRRSSLADLSPADVLAGLPVDRK
ncbi:MAG: glycosyltransferase family 9 protein [Rhodospirillales bacterium]|nr:glycosyltransferase family 9 protein [Rhodospirillales bacterium]MCW8861654.1 glycosyltransferase family 9 protein [Rhodospirillales bacterium]MCW8951694.1 glycosyltransferase family 9 protein [Rhodospirillales bacterium]MCW9001306.1 glycosyltransferase family 9 protein [Rhodospirillales bacterium]